MTENNRPLYTLTVAEYIALHRQIATEILPVSPPIETEKDEQLTIAELANRLQCSKVTIHKYRKQGLPSYQIGRKVLFSWRKVLDFMAKTKKRK